MFVLNSRTPQQWEHYKALGIKDLWEQIELKKRIEILRARWLERPSSLRKGK